MTTDDHPRTVLLYVWDCGAYVSGHYHLDSGWDYLLNHYGAATVGRGVPPGALPVARCLSHVPLPSAAVHAC